MARCACSTTPCATEASRTNARRRQAVPTASLGASLLGKGQVSIRRPVGTPAWRPRALYICALTSEVDALQLFSGGEQNCSLVPKAVEKLSSAAPPNKSVPPVEVQGAMTFLEQMRDLCPDVPSFKLTGPELLQKLDGDWQLHFSTFSEAFPYLPLLEIVRIDTGTSTISVINQFGPLGLTFSSGYVFSVTSCEFGFETLTVDLFGNTVWKKELSERKMKWYNFFYTDDSVSCVRSSTGALTLLFRCA